MDREWSVSCSVSERIIADIPLASVAAILPVSRNASVAPSSSADAPESDFHSVLASYAPANDAARDTTSAPAKSAQDSTATEKQPSVQKEIKALPVSARSVASSNKTADLSQKDDRRAKAREEQLADREHAAARPAKPAVQPTAIAAVSPIASQSTRADVAMAAEIFASPVAQQPDDSAADDGARETPPLKSDPVHASTPEPGLSSTSNSLDAHEHGAAVDREAHTPQIKSANPRPQPATSAAVVAAKAQTLQTEPETETQTTPQIRPAQPIQSSVLAMFNVLRGAIATTLSPKQTVAPPSGVKLNEPSAKTAANPVVSGTDTTPKSAAADKDVIKSTDFVRIVASVADDTSDDSDRPVAAVAQKPVQSASTVLAAKTASPQTDDTARDTAEPVAAIPQTAPRPNSVATAPKTNGDKVSAQPDQRNADANGLSSKPENAVSTDTTVQSATTAPQPSNIAVPAIVPSVATNAVAAPFQASAAAPSAPAAQDLAVSPNVAALATAILAKSASGTKTFDIRMDPPELGRVDVHLSVDSDGKVQALLSAEHPQTLALLQRDSQNLERALKDAGLLLSNNSLNFSLKGEGRQGDGGGASMARARSLPDAVVARAEAANASEINLSSALGNGRLDIRV